TLNRVNDEQNITLAAITADRGKVVAKAAGEFDKAQRDDARTVINQVQNLPGLQTAIAFARHFYLDAEFALDPHPRNNVGREFAIGGGGGGAPGASGAGWQSSPTPPTCWARTLSRPGRR